MLTLALPATRWLYSNAPRGERGVASVVELTIQQLQHGLGEVQPAAQAVSTSGSPSRTLGLPSPAPEPDL